MFSEYCSISALSCSFEFMVVSGVGGGSQRLVSLNPTTMLVVLFLELWLLLGCDNLYHPGSDVFFHKIKQVHPASLRSSAVPPFYMVFTHSSSPHVRQEIKSMVLQLRVYHFRASPQPIKIVLTLINATLFKSASSSHTRPCN